MIQYTVKVSDDKTEWYNEKGELHREDGPAVEWACGHKSWFKEGQRHRENGPAIEWANGYKEWYLDGVEVTEDEVMKPTKELTVAEIEKILGHRVKVIK